jgi:hypothetical protein
MSGSTSDNRTCDKCGYVLSPFETECPKCARLAAAHPPPEVTAPVTPHTELEEFKINLKRETDRRTRRNVIVIIISVVAAIIMTVPVLFVFALAAGSLGGIDASGFLWGSLLFIAVIAFIMYFSINRIAPYVPKSQIASEEEVGPWYNPIPYYSSKSQTPKNEKAAPWHKNPVLLFIYGLAAMIAVTLITYGIFTQVSVRASLLRPFLGLVFVIGWVIFWIYRYLGRRR